jgi:hypothetical protein
MGGRGGEPGNNKGKKRVDPWEWLKDVETDRLKTYVSRSKHLGKKKDPQERNIHSVFFHAKKILMDRGSKCD